MFLGSPVRYRIEYPVDPDIPAQARACVRTALAGVPAEAVDAVELVVSELLTNGVRHTAGPTVRLTLDIGPDGCVVGVADHGPRDGGKPSFNGCGSDGELAESGRGLPLVAALCVETGVDWADWNEDGVEVWGRVAW